MAIQSHRQKLDKAQKLKEKDAPAEVATPASMPQPNVSALATMGAYKDGFQKSLAGAEMPQEIQAMFSGYFDYCLNLASKQGQVAQEPKPAETVPVPPKKTESSGASASLKRDSLDAATTMTDEAEEEKEKKKMKAADVRSDEKVDGESATQRRKEN